MARLIFALFSLAAVSCNAYGMTITKSGTTPPQSDLLIGIDTAPTENQGFLTMDRGGGGEAAYGQTFQFDTDVLLDKITFKVQTTQNVDGKPLLLWFGTGHTGVIYSGLSSLMLDPEADLPSGMGGSGDIWYLTLDVTDQSLVANQTYAFMTRFASGTSGGGHSEMGVGFMGAYSYDDGAAFTFGVTGRTITVPNNEMVFFLHGSVVPEPGALSIFVVGIFLAVGSFPHCCKRANCT